MLRAVMKDQVHYRVVLIQVMMMMMMMMMTLAIKACDKKNTKANNKTACLSMEKKDFFVFQKQQEEAFSDTAHELDKPCKYFKQFLTDELLKLLVDNTSMHSTQKTGKRINTLVDEISTFI